MCNCAIIYKDTDARGEKLEYNNLFRLAVDNAIEMFLVFDDKGRIVYGNRTVREALEYYDELCSCSIADIFPGKFDIRWDKLYSTCQMDDEFRNMMAYRKNRTCFQVNAKFLIHNQVYICMAYDATKEKYLEKMVSAADDEVEAALKVKSEFVANVTHELRTPVNGILGNTQELLGKEEDKDKLKVLRMIERGCRDMNAIINNVLDFSKLEAGKFTLEKREFEFRNMIEYVKSNHNSRVTEKGLELSVVVSPGIPEHVVGDELRIAQVLNNLISNAYKFTSVGGIHVEVVKTAQENNRIELFFMVIDSGIGISKADQDKLFKSFSQVDASISRRYGGTGLGLNICKQLVELMGGDIHVESEVGKGSTFSFQIWVELPEGDGESQQEEKENSNTNLFRLEYESEPQSIETVLERLKMQSQEQVSENVWEYGTEENRAELEKKMSKLILSIEMENWEKAEMFAEAVKQLVETAPREIKSAALRMKMVVQKGDHDKAVAAHEVFKNTL